MGKTKKAGIIARALTCLAATVAIVLGTAAPAFAAGEVTDSVDTSNINVTVPTTIPCIMLADGTVVVPSDLSIVNSGDAVVVDAYTADAMGNAVDFTLDIGGTRALSRSGGKDTAPTLGIDFPSGSKGINLKVSKLDRKMNAALMDKASSGGTDMFKLGFKFSEKLLQGDVSISGDATVGSTLTVTTSILQTDAKASYQWYRDGSAISGATSDTYTTVEADAGHEIICKVADTSGRYKGTLTSNVIRPTALAEPFAVYSEEDGSLSFYNRPGAPSIGSTFEGKMVTDVFKGFEEDSYPWSAKVPWNKYASSVKNVTFVDKVAPKSTAFWFGGFNHMVSAELHKLDTSAVSDMTSMFFDCTRLKNLDVSGFDTSSSTNMHSMFYNCDALTFLDLSHFDTSLVTNMSDMFLNCDLLESVDVSSFNTSNVNEMQNMFMECRSLVSVDISSFDTSSVTKMWLLFYGDYTLQRVTLSDRFTWKADYSPGCGMLPKPDASYIPGADGKWYNSRGVGFTPDKIPSNVADTYTAWDPNLHGSVNITGDMQNGLKAKVSGAQSDAKLAFEWHRKRTVTDSFTWDIPMLTPAQRTISVGENAYIEVSMMDSNPVRNGYTIVVTGDSGEVYRQTFVEFGTATIQIPTSGVYFLRIENTDPMAHTAYVRITSDKDSLIAGAASDSIGVSEAGDYYCVVTDTSGKYKGQLVSNTLTVR